MAGVGGEWKHPAQLTGTICISLTRAPVRLREPRGEPGSQARRQRARLGRGAKRLPDPNPGPGPNYAPPSLGSARLRQPRLGCETARSPVRGWRQQRGRGVERLAVRRGVGADGECVRREAEDDEDENADANEEGEGFSSVVTM